MAVFHLDVETLGDVVLDKRIEEILKIGGWTTALIMSQERQQRNETRLLIIHLS